MTSDLWAELFTYKRALCKQDLFVQGMHNNNLYTQAPVTDEYKLKVNIFRGSNSFLNKSSQVTSDYVTTTGLVTSRITLNKQ